MKNLRLRGFLLACALALVFAVAPASAQRGLDLAPALAAQAHHTDNLLKIPGIAGTAVGLGTDGQPVVKIYTEKSGIGGLPQTLDGVPVEIQVTGKIQPLAPPPGKGGGHGVNPTAKFTPPVPLGVSSGNIQSIQIVGLFITCTSGTLGARLRNGAGTYYALSNNHVYALSNDAVLNDSGNPATIVQPGPADTNCDAGSSNDIGTLTAFVTLKYDGTDNKVDAAIAATTTSDVKNQFWDGATSPSGTTRTLTGSDIGLAVRKYGAVSKLTVGKVAAVNATLNIDYGNDADGNPRIAHFVSQIEFSGCKGKCIKAGDSGSTLLTNDSAHNPVGLLFAGDQTGGTAWANPIADVLSQLNTALGGGANLNFQ
ncbi:MAG TPA: hypothetical protein VL754_00610 [Verrucomicrobiae bacterium]|jgi:hypothetical protein|nr:hypothetical protein [Verrucomicrobiae bacterium]